MASRSLNSSALEISARSPPSNLKDECVDMALQPRHKANSDIIAGRSKGDRLRALRSILIRSTSDGTSVDQKGFSSGASGRSIRMSFAAEIAVVANPFSPLLLVLGCLERLVGNEAADDLVVSVEIAEVGATLVGFLKLLKTDEVLSCATGPALALISGKVGS